MIEKKPEIKKSSARRIAASRANGARSRGPVTPEGRQRSSQNALKHGLASATILLATEDWESYLKCRQAYISRFQPADDIELDLVEEMVAARWRQQRMWVIESAALDDQLEAQRADIDQEYEDVTPDVRTALAFSKLADESRALALINRYESRYSRQFHRALKALQELQANRPPALSPSQPSDNMADHRSLTTDHCISPNEPNPISEQPSESAGPANVARPPRIVLRRQMGPALIFSTAPQPSAIATDHWPLLKRTMPMTPSTGPLTRRSLLLGAGAAASAQILKLPARVRAAIIGLDGHPGEITKPLNDMPDVEIVAIADPDARAIERFKRGKPRLANAKSYSDYRRMLDVEKPDVVAVCNTDGDRAAAIVEAARRKHNVIAEKPLALTRADLDRVKSAVEQNHIHLGMLLPMRFSPPYRMLKQIVDSGDIGEVVQISAQKSYQLEDRPEWFKHRETYGSTILWIGPHMLDLMRFTSGRSFSEVASFMGRPQFPDTGSMETSTATCLRLDNTGTAVLHMDYCRPATAPTHGDDRLRLAGTKGVAEYMEATGVTLMTSGAKLHRIDKLPPDGSVFRDYIAHVYAGQPTGLPVADIYAVCTITIAAHESAAQNRLIRLA